MLNRNLRAIRRLLEQYYPQNGMPRTSSDALKRVGGFHHSVLVGIARQLMNASRSVGLRGDEMGVGRRPAAQATGVRAALEDLDRNRLFVPSSLVNGVDNRGHPAAPTRVLNSVLQVPSRIREIRKPYPVIAKEFESVNTSRLDVLIKGVPNRSVDHECEDDTSEKAIVGFAIRNTESQRTQRWGVGGGELNR
jgi:hypothetical protein